MESTDRQQKYTELRNEYPWFSFDGYDIIADKSQISVTYFFNLSGKYSFTPGFRIPFKPVYKVPFTSELRNNPLFDALIFQIGMIELISYWKAACAPAVIVRPHKLDEWQVNWWKKVYFNGLGEFFYLNNIKTSARDFMKIESHGTRLLPRSIQLDEGIIVPVGGGKDSIVTLELLRKEQNIVPFILNPRGATLQTLEEAGIANTSFTEIHRNIHPQLLKLNDQGFLNGHTPFSAMLAFYTLLESFLTGQRHIALSNESSANEATDPVTGVNHQYSKSFEFESDFREYVNHTLSPSFNYFSFLRPLNELQIAGIFADNIKYYPVFKSCNVGSKTDIWCGNCPKCLFAWIILSPFIPLNELVYIFGKNMFADASLLPYLKQLTGIEEVKPFECVGTVNEVNAALLLYIRRHQAGKWPVLLDFFSNTELYARLHNYEPQQVLQEYNPDHFVLPQFEKILKEKLACKNW
jgi:UDP-N-acetyl-alpha-D-muramoyl-L-alanyl-L-glutamate epimerase